MMSIVNRGEKIYRINMRKKTKDTAYFCQNCGHEEAKWHGQCPACHEWNTLIEEKIQVLSTKNPLSVDGVFKVTEVAQEAIERHKIGLAELDLVLGGGLVKGQVTLIGGEPGAGKSTLLQMSSHLLAKQGAKVLYVSGEESKEQIAVSLRRLNALSDNFYIFSHTDIDRALHEASALSVGFLVLDSVQTLSSSHLDSAPGSVAQIREVCAKAINFAKSLNIPTFIVGHVTKDGQIAGPRLLEHMVDTVLYFEQSRSDQYRLLRAHKNRFGSTNEMGIFEMSSNGLIGISNLSAYFLKERPENKPGSAIFCALEGTRPLLVEIQALTVETLFGSPRRTCVGLDQTRASVIAAVLEKHAGLMLSRLDLFVSVAGGLSLEEPALDLPLALAIASSVKNLPLPHDMVAIGELGLSGEIRSAFRLPDRLKEASRFGFNKALVPKVAMESLGETPEGLRLKGVASIDEAIAFLLKKNG